MKKLEPPFVSVEALRGDEFAPFGSIIAAEETIDSPRFNRSPGCVLLVHKQLDFRGPGTGLLTLELLGWERWAEPGWYYPFAAPKRSGRRARTV